jgi:nicotinamide riboside transporter PnuC
MPRIFGREPALWLALVAVAVKLATAFGLDVSSDQQAVINACAAAIVGLVVAVMVHDGISAAVLGLVQAGLALAVGFGLDWSADQQAVVMSAAAALVGMFVRTQVTAKVSRASVDLAA